MSFKSKHCFQIINPETLYNPQAFAYNHVVEVRNFQRILHIAGQGGENQAGEFSHDFSEQVWQALWPEQNFPACPLIPVTGLALPNMQFEVEATAYTH